MNYQELAEITGLKYGTARKYAVLLQDEGIIDEIDDGTVALIKAIPVLTKQGLTIKEAIEKISADRKLILGRDDIAIRLESFEERLETLAEENKKLREIVETQESEIHKLQGRKYPVPIRTTELVARIDGTGILRTVMEKTIDFFGWLFSVEKTDDAMSPIEIEKLEKSETRTINCDEE